LAQASACNPHKSDKSGISDEKQQDVRYRNSPAYLISTGFWLLEARGTEALGILFCEQGGRMGGIRSFARRQDRGLRAQSRAGNGKDQTLRRVEKGEG
jgi:hypothetical protein